jgi:hypothetical protein
MTTRLERPIRRELWIDDRPYTLTVTAAGFALTEKRRRNGNGLRWQDLVRGETRIVSADPAEGAQRR